MRGLVIALLCASVLAMFSVSWAAFRVVGKAFDTPNITPEEIALPEGATPLSFTELREGESVVIYQLDGQYFGRISDKMGDEISTVSFP